MGNTKVDLVKDLENYLKANVVGSEQAIRIGEVIRRAKTGYYHDFESELATPKIQLHMDLLSAGLKDLDKKMQNGDYDNEAPSKEEEKRLMDLLLKKGGN